MYQNVHERNIVNMAAEEDGLGKAEMGKIEEELDGESSESEAEGKPFHRRISTNKEIKCSVSFNDSLLGFYRI